MNLFESIKNKHLENIQRRPRFIKESAEGGKEFWDKVDAGEIKVGGTLDSNGAGDIDVLDLNKNADYILIKRNSDYQPFVAAWAPEFYNGKLTWGQGHYFDNEDDAREYFNQKALGECDKKEVKEAEEPIEEAKGSWLETCYIPNRDTTIIFRHTTQGNDAVVEELVNYYYGSPNENATREMAKEPAHPLVMDMLEPEEFKDFVSGFDEEFIKESCGKKKRPTLKESNPARYLGIKQELNEAINHANDDINAKIKEALRSKTAARKYRKDLEDAGIKIDDSPREGVNLIGPNGRMLSADRQNIYGPTKPGHAGTHDSSRYGNSVKNQKRDLANYDERITKDKERIAGLNSLQRDDIIRKYPENTTEEALAKHEKEIKSANEDLAYDRRWRKGTEKELRDIHRRRDVAHKSYIEPGYSDTTIDREQYYKDPKNTEGRGYSKLVDAIDYKGYLDSPDRNENKDFTNSGRYRATPGQKLRQEFKDLKNAANNTYYGTYDSKRDLEDKAIDAQAIDARKKEIEAAYKQQMDREVNDMLERKSNADASYKRHKDIYKDRINAVKDFRAKHGMAAKEDPDFETYINKKAESRY